MMVKLNYMNRKSEGVKLGQIVAKDLRKRIKPLTASSKPDTHRDTSPLELNLEGKNLTDEGLQEAANGLNDALANSSGSFETKLQILNLARNGLTSASLSKLAPCFGAACYDLEDLDLSGNDISVHSDDDAQHWETFLRSLGRCQALKRLNLANNDFAGSRAFEIFARVYLSQFHRDELRLDQYMNVISDGMDDSAVGVLEIRENLRALSFEAPGMTINAPVQGLPSIQTLSFVNSSMTDGGALFLSYTMGQHLWVQGRVSEHVLHPKVNSEIIGIVYQPNDRLTPVGLKMLKHAESISYDPFDAPEAPFGPENSPVSRHESSAGLQSRNASSAHHRKSSVGSTLSEPLAMRTAFHTRSPAYNELESYRRKAQRAILEDQGARSVELWGTALTLLAYARHILIANHSTEDLSSLKEFTFPKPKPSEALRPNGRRRPSDISEAKFVTPSPSSSGGRQTPILATVSISVSPVTPQSIPRPHPRRESFSVRSDSADPKSRSKSHDTTPNSVRSQAHLDTASNHIRKIGPLPEKAWEIIIIELADPRGVLSRRQREAVMAWGRDRRTLAEEAVGKGKPDAVQMWKVLDGMGCLALDESAWMADGGE